MRKLRWIAPVILAVLIVLAGGIYGSFWYITKSRLDDLITQLKMHGVTLAYDSVFVNPLNSTVGADQVDIRTPDGLHSHIGRVRLQTNLMFLLRSQSFLQAGKWPETVTLHLQQVKYDSSLLEKFSTSLKTGTSKTADVQSDVLVCGETDLRDLKALGYHQLTGNIYAEFHWKEALQQFELRLIDNLDDIVSMDADVVVGVDQGKVTPQAFMAANPRIKTVQISLQDEGLVTKIGRVCARAMKIKPVDFRKQFKADASVYGNDDQIQMPEPILSAIQKVIDPGVNYTLRLTPPAGIGPDVLFLKGQPHQLLSYLNPTLEVNGKKIDLVHLDWGWIQRSSKEYESRLNVRAKLSAESKPAVSEPEKSIPPKPATPAHVGVASDGSTVDMDAYLKRIMKEQKEEQLPDPEFHKIIKSDLHRYVGHDVKILTDTGYRVDGRLLSAGDSMVKVRQRVDKGTAVYPLLMPQIIYVEVFY